MLIYMGELLSAETVVNDDGKAFTSLVFRSERYDFKLQENVPFGEGVIVTDECVHFLNNYKKHVGEMVSISVRPIIGKNKRDIYYLTLSDVLDPAEVLTA